MQTSLLHYKPNKIVQLSITNRQLCENYKNVLLFMFSACEQGEKKTTKISVHSLQNNPVCLRALIPLNLTC